MESTTTNEKITPFQSYEEHLIAFGLFHLFTVLKGLERDEDWHLLDDMLEQGGYTSSQKQDFQKILKRNDTTRLRTSIGRYVLAAYKKQNK
jgi:hypothetical protein